MRVVPGQEFESDVRYEVVHCHDAAAKFLQITQITSLALHIIMKLTKDHHAIMLLVII